jgi:hypothetical protein
MTYSEVDLLALTRVDRLVQNRREADQGGIDLRVTKEIVPAVRIERVHRRPQPTDDKINEAFRRATSC